MLAGRVRPPARGKKKEKGENIRLIMERNQLERAVYIGDTQGDLDASHAAGIPFIYAAYGFGSVNEDVPSVQEPSQISQAIARILKKMPARTGKTASTVLNISK